MSILYIIEVFWIFRIVCNVLSFVQLWYVKEYRFDRMRIHLRTNQGKRLYILPFRRPPLTIKSVSIVLGSFTVLYSVYVALPYFVLWRLIILDLLSFPATAFFVMCFRVPTGIIHSRKIQRAVALLRHHKKMTVIGITGSYGKTSTKEILATLMESEFTVLKTPASKNSPIAIAELLQSKLEPDHDAFIVEMGAYKQGEISDMCEMVHPSIAIITAINEQHQDMFGSIDQTIEAKYELIRGLHGIRHVVVNADNPYTRQMGNRAQTDGCHVMYYSVENNPLATIYATEPKQLSDRITFSVHLNGKKYAISAALLGVHYISNILAAIGAGLAAGVGIKDLVNRCQSIVAFDHIMQKLSGIHGSIFIDDTFNNNPDAALAALQYLKVFTKRKILVFQPMIELGGYSKESHRKVGAAAAEICDDIILTNDNYYKDFMRGVYSVSVKKKVQILSEKNAASYIRLNVKKGDVVLFKGRESARVFRELC